MHPRPAPTTNRAPRPATRSAPLPTLAHALATVALGAGALAGCKRNPFCTPELERALRMDTSTTSTDAPAPPRIDPASLVATTPSTTKPATVVAPSFYSHVRGRMPVSRWHPPPAPVAHATHSTSGPRTASAAPQPLGAMDL